MLLWMIRGRGCDAHHYIHALSKNLNAFNITTRIIYHVLYIDKVNKDGCKVGRYIKTIYFIYTKI